MLSRHCVHATMIVIACIIAACTGDSPVSDPTLVKSDLAREMNPQASDEDLAAVVSGNTELALTLLPLLDETPDTNTFFSPYSITQAFALLAPGARGATLGEIEQTLSFSLPQDRLNPAFNRLDLLLAGKTSGAVLSNGKETPRFTNANAVWGQEGFSILPEYLDTIAINFGAGLHVVDFVNDPEAARLTINDWVGEQTNDRILDLIPEGGVSPDTRLVLTNAVWFKASWADQFSEGSTADGTFVNRDGSSSTIRFMRQISDMPYVQTAGCQAVDIPYAGDELSMLVIMPDAGGFDAFLSSLTPAVLAGITTGLTATTIDFSLPKFTFTATSPLASVLKGLGMTTPFDPSLADFSGIDGGRDLVVQNVFHQAFIAVDEKGTEAAAATAIDIGAISMPVVEVTLAIDHPFLFLIRDRETGLILFMGKVAAL